MINNPQKQTQTKLTKGLLDMITLQLLQTQPMHGYQIITTIRKTYGTYFGPSTIYPMLSLMEKKGYLKSAWDMSAEKPRKTYTLTSTGQTVLKFTENSLEMICKTLSCNTTLNTENDKTSINSKTRLQIIR